MNKIIVFAMLMGLMVVSTVSNAATGKLNKASQSMCDQLLTTIVKKKVKQNVAAKMVEKAKFRNKKEADACFQYMLQNPNIIKLWKLKFKHAKKKKQNSKLPNASLGQSVSGEEQFQDAMQRAAHNRRQSYDFKIALDTTGSERHGNARPKLSQCTRGDSVIVEKNSLLASAPFIVGVKGMIQGQVIADRDMQIEAASRLPRGVALKQSNGSWILEGKSTRTGDKRFNLVARTQVNGDEIAVQQTLTLRFIEGVPIPAPEPPNGCGSYGGDLINAPLPPKFKNDPLTTAFIGVIAAHWPGVQYDRHRNRLVSGNEDVVPDLFTPQCNRHDTCYGTIGTTQRQCDSVMRREMYDSCNRQRNRGGTLQRIATLGMQDLWAEFCYAVATGYYEVLYAVGEDAHRDAQIAAMSNWRQARDRWEPPRCR